MAQHKGGAKVDPVTRDDLEKSLEKTAVRIEKEMKALIEPIIKEQGEVRLILNGPTLVNGLVGKMKTMGVHVKLIYVVISGSLVKFFYDYVRS